MILHADIVDSTGIVQKNESLAHLRIRETFGQLASSIEQNQGTVHELSRDALLAVFPRASDAVNARLGFQESQRSRLAAIEDDILPVVRVGIAMGEVIIADGTITGGGVVKAQRLEQLSDPGGVVIRGAVYETLPKHLPLTFSYLGEQDLKGFSETVRSYAVSSGLAVPESQLKEISTHVATPQGVPQKPSIAVLPFTNVSGDREQEYFSDGITEDIITELSGFHSLVIIARNSSFRFKGTGQGIREIGQELGVQFIVEGSVRKAGNRARIIAQLIDAQTKNQVWAERYDRHLEDIFAVQDEVTRSIVAVLPGRIQEDIVDRAARKPTENMKAYELMLQGKAFRDQLSADGNAAARRCCEKAREVVVEAMALGPLHPPTLDWILGQVRFFDGRYDEVIDLLYGKARLNSLAHAFVAAAHAMLGHTDSAELALQTFIEQRRREFQIRDIEVANNSIQSLAGACKAMWKDSANWQQHADGLRKTGLPDS